MIWSCFILERFLFLGVALFNLERFVFLVKVGVVFFPYNLERFAFLVKVGTFFLI